MKLLFNLAFIACWTLGIPLTHASAQIQVLANVRPMVFNAPHSARPGDIIGLQGANFGSMPTVGLKRPGLDDQTLPIINTFRSEWVSFKIPADSTGAIIVTVSNGVEKSEEVAINSATPYHLDTLQIVPGGSFRIFGKSLLSPGFTPSLTVNGVAAKVDVTISNEHMLVATVPTSIPAESNPVIKVDNGNGTGPTALDRALTMDKGGVDVFKLGVGWGGGFERIGTRVVTLTSSNSRTCNGGADDTPQIQAAVDLLTASGGGVLQLPIGICRFAGSLKLKSHVVLRGSGKDKTFIYYDSNYPIWGRNLDLAGVADLTMRNTKPTIESTLLQNSIRVFFKNVRFELGGGLQMFLNGNTNFAIENSDFIQPNKNGPFYLGQTGGLVFHKNTLSVANGSAAFTGVHDSYIADNHFTRDYRYSALSTDVTHPMVLDFAHRIAVVGNTFDVLGGPVANKLRGDGETIISEGGGGNRTENVGFVISAKSDSLTDPNLKALARRRPVGDSSENFGIAIVNGTGAGQSRRVTAINGDTISVYPPWTQTPDASSHYATFQWGLEKALIKDNMFKDNPRGIWLYQTALRDVDIIGNTMLEGGGIYLRSAQNMKDKLFTPMFGVRISDNRIVNTKAQWRSYIAVMFVRMGEEDFGVGTTGVEIKNNFLVANTPNLTQYGEESGEIEGFVNRMRVEDSGNAQTKYQTRLLGTIFQNNHCNGCNANILVREGTKATVLEGNTNSTTEVQSK